MLLDVLGGPGAGSGEFDGASGVAIASDGSIYVADEQNSRIQRFAAPVTDVPGGPIVSVRARAQLSLAPNPCRLGTRLAAALPSADHVRLTIVDLQGRTVATLLDRNLSSGTHQVGWDTRQTDGRPAPAGVYHARLASSNGQTTTTRVHVLR